MTLVDFTGANGSTPYAPPIQGRDGNFYGTTGGDSTVFKITPDGTFTTLHQFSEGDGDSPISALVLGVDGNLYGTTEYGGNGAFNGTRLSNHTRGPVHSSLPVLFPTNCADGNAAIAGLVQGKDGNFYGATYEGGTGNIYNGGGTIYKITPAGKLTTLYSFCTLVNCADGADPAHTLTLGTNGLLYGTTASGGTNGQGTLFEISLSGNC